MPHKLRVEFPRASYHVIENGVDRQDFLKALAEARHREFGEATQASLNRLLQSFNFQEE